MHLAPGTAVSARLKLQRPLGEGAMGSVWVASLAGRVQPVAVKFMTASASRDRSLLVRFQREAAAASKIDSPNVVRILEHGATEDGTPYIVMELLEGETLGERLARIGRFGLDDAAAIVRQVAYALEAAHRIGIVHRDIKPDNIFLVGHDDFPLVKILDFGMAKDTRGENNGELTAAGVAVGTPEYMSPEQVLGGKDVDHQSDLWALGVVAYRVLAGATPFAGESPHALFFAICRGAYRPLEEVHVPPLLDAWFKRALSPKKPSRFSSGRELVEAFDLVLRELRATTAAEEDVSFGFTAQFDTSVIRPSISAQPTNPVGPSIHPDGSLSFDESVTAEQNLEPSLRAAMDQVQALRRTAKAQQPAAEERLEHMIDEAVRSSGRGAPPELADEASFFEPPSQRGLEPALLDDLASLEDPPPSASGAASARPAPTLADVSSMADGASMLPIRDEAELTPPKRPASRRMGVLAVLLVVAAGVGAWLQLRGR